MTDEVQDLRPGAMEAAMTIAFLCLVQELEAANALAPGAMASRLRAHLNEIDRGPLGRLIAGQITSLAYALEQVREDADRDTQPRN